MAAQKDGRHGAWLQRGHPEVPVSEDRGLRRTLASAEPLALLDWGRYVPVQTRASPAAVRLGAPGLKRGLVSGVCFCFSFVVGLLA